MFAVVCLIGRRDVTIWFRPIFRNGGEKEKNKSQTEQWRMHVKQGAKKSNKKFLKTMDESEGATAYI